MVATTKNTKLQIELMARILDNPEIEHKKSKFSKSEAFFFRGKEIGHFHSPNEMDIRVTKSNVKQLIASDDDRLFRRSPSSDWIEVKFQKKSDLKFVLDLVDLAIRATRRLL